MVACESWGLLAALALLAALIPGVEWYLALPIDGSLSGADGVWTLDQFQYLAWIRDSGEHFRVANLFDIPRSRGLFIHPMWLLSGLLWKLGVPIQYALVPWKILGIGILWWAVSWYCDRLIPQRGHRFAAKAIALFYVSPLIPLVSLVTTNDISRWELLVYGEEMFSAVGAWGYPLISISTALLVLCVILIEQSLTSVDGPRQRLALASAVGLMASWIHPWQGVTVVMLIALLVASYRFSRNSLSLLTVAGVTALPLAGYFVLGHLDDAWRNARLATIHPRFPMTLAVAVLPLAAIAVLGLQRPTDAVRERVLLLWPLAALINFAVDPQWPSHALGGLAIPLAILAVRALARVKTPWVLASVTVLLTLPGSLHFTKETLESVVDNARVRAEVLTASEVEALRYLEMRRDGEGVLAQRFFASAIPAWTGHPVWAGHQVWSPSFDSRANRVDALMAGALSADLATELVTASHARYVLARCEDSPDLSQLLAPMVRAVHTFGCVTLFDVANKGTASPRSILTFFISPN